MVVASALKRGGVSNHAYSFLPIEVSHVRRGVNKAAHVLVRCALSQLLDEIWITECPSFI
jgi:hypothetical protein